MTTLSFTASTHRPSLAPAIRNLIPGVLLSVGISAAAILVQALEVRLTGRPWLEALVIAILLGGLVRTIWEPGPRWRAGIHFGGKVLLEVAIVLLGATVSARTVLGAGPPLLAGIVAIVAVSIILSYGLGRLMRLPHRMALLIACGNSICGNSAIAAVAPVIDADSDDVATAIAFTAVLGVVVVLALPVLAIAWRMSPNAFGIFAGLTVYAVPQVLAATAPISSVSAQVGTLVKLVRVLMLGPVVLVLSLITPKTSEHGARPRAALHHLVPWFIIGFLAMMAARSAGLIPAEALSAASQAATWLTIVAMAALGLGVDVRAIAGAGPRVIAVVTLSLVALGGLALLMIAALGLR